MVRVAIGHVMGGGVLLILVDLRGRRTIVIGSGMTQLGRWLEMLWERGVRDPVLWFEFDLVVVGHGVRVYWVDVLV